MDKNFVRAGIVGLILMGLLVRECVWVEAGTTGIISGVVKSADKGTPISGANVIVTGTKLSTVTDGQGYYVITNVPPGEYEVTAEMVGFAKQATGNVQVTMDATTTANFDMKQEAIQEEAVVVSRPRPMVSTSTVNTLNQVNSQQEPLTRIDPASLKTAPGVLSTLPGVTVEPDGSGQMHIRGGQPDQIGWYIEGIPITDPNTGLFGTNLFTTGMSKFQAYTGGFGTEYGNAISGVLNEVLKTGGETTGFNLDAEGGSSIYRSGLFEVGSGPTAGFNYYVGSNMLQTNLDGPVVKSQSFADNVAKLVWPSKNDTVTVLGLQGSLVGWLTDSHDVGDNSQPVTPSTDYMRQRYAVTGITWNHNFDAQSFLTVRPYFLETIIDQNVMGGSTGLPYYLSEWSDREGLQLGYTSQLNDSHLLKVGGSVLASNNNDYMYATYQGTVVPTYNFRADVNTFQGDMYAQDQIKMGKKWTADAGLRYEAITYDRTGLAYVSGEGYTGAPLPNVSESQISPRMGLSYAVDDTTAWKMDVGRYVKFVPASDVQRIYFDPNDAEPAQPGLGSTSSERSTNAEISYEKQVSDTVAVRVTPFYAIYDNLGELFTDSAGITEYTNLGKGNSRGMELYVRKKMSSNWQGWLSYTYQKVKANRLDLGLLSDDYYTSWDQRQTMSAGYRLQDRQVGSQHAHGLRQRPGRLGVRP